MARLTFAYDFEKDVANFMRGTRAKNSAKLTNLQRRYLEKYGEPYEAQKACELIVAYHKERGFDANRTTRYIEEKWHPIEQAFFSRADALFGATLTRPITAYLTTNSRCTYAIHGGYFFVYFDSDSPNRVIMHELLHFYTHDTFHEALMASGVDETHYNDIKESLTVLLNIEFADLMDGAVDEGYPQHADLRSHIRDEWLATRDLRKTLKVVLECGDEKSV